MLTITTNNRERAITVGDDGKEYVNAYGRTWSLEDVERAPHYILARGYDGTILESTNVGTWGIVLRYFDRDGYELEGVIVGWYENL